MFFSSHSCFREKSVMTPGWNWFFDLLFCAFVTIITHNGPPQRILPYVWLLKNICSETCTPMDGRKEDICTFPCLRLTILGDSLTTICLAPSTPLPLSLFYQRTWHPDSEKMVILSISLPFSQSIGFLNSLVLLASTAHLLILLACPVASRVNLDRVAQWFSLSLNFIPKLNK